MNAPNADARVQHATTRLLEMWESGDLPTAVAKVFIRRQTAERPSDRWSLGNQLLCMLAGTDDARGFRQGEEAGRHVTKGSKAVWILGPVTRRVKDSEAVAAAGGSNDTTIVVGFRGIPVFRFEDTEGEPIVVPDYTPPMLYQGRLGEALAVVARPVGRSDRRAGAVARPTDLVHRLWLTLPQDVQVGQSGRRRRRARKRPPIPARGPPPSLTRCACGVCISRCLRPRALPRPMCRDAGQPRARRPHLV